MDAQQWFCTRANDSFASMNIALLIIAFILAAVRIAGHKSEAFQAVAHVFVSYLFTAAYYEYRATWTEGGKAAMQKAYIAIGLSIVEIIAFIVRT